MLSTSEKEKLTKAQKDFNNNLNNERFKGLFFSLQFIALIMSIILYATSFFVPSTREFAKIVLAILLMIMAYNNKTYIKRKNATIIYILLCIVFLISGIIGLVK